MFRSIGFWLNDLNFCDFTEVVSERLLHMIFYGQALSIIDVHHGPLVWVLDV